MSILKKINESDIYSIINFFVKHNTKTIDDLYKTFVNKIKGSDIINSLERLINKPKELLLIEMIKIKKYLDDNLPPDQREYILKIGADVIKNINENNNYNINESSDLNYDFIITEIDKKYGNDVDNIISKYWDSTVEKMVNEIDKLNENDAMIKMLELKLYLEKKMDTKTKNTLTTIGNLYLESRR